MSQGVELKLFDGCPIAIVGHQDGSIGEMLSTRYDLYPYEGGIGWGYKGSGAKNLAYALAGRFCVNPNDHVEIDKFAMDLLNSLICDLDNDKEYVLSNEEIMSHFSGKPTL